MGGNFQRVYRQIFDNMNISITTTFTETISSLTQTTTSTTISSTNTTEALYDGTNVLNSKCVNKFYCFYFVMTFSSCFVFFMFMAN